MRALLGACSRCCRRRPSVAYSLVSRSRHAATAHRAAHIQPRPIAIALAEPPEESNNTDEEEDVYDPNIEAAEREPLELSTAPTIYPPPLSAQQNPAAWAASVEPYLPSRLRSAHPRWPLAPNYLDVRIESLPELVLLARRSSNVDVLANFALEHGRWDAMLWLADAILHVCKGRYSPYQDRAILQSIQWPKRAFLDDLTADSTALKDAQKSERPQQPTHALEHFTRFRFSTSRILSDHVAHKQLGSLWETIGHLILTATSHDAPNGAEVLRYALRLLGQLHFHGFIPSKVYNDPSSHETAGVRQPTLLSEISPAIMSALLDASLEQITDPSDPESIDPFVKLDIGPGLWMEFVLWCCVRGGWLDEASTIVDSLRIRTDADAWHLVCWQQLESSPESTLTDLMRRRAPARVDSSVEPAPAAREDDLVTGFERTISSEVVVALVDALASAVQSSPNFDYPLQRAGDRVSHLRAFLDREHMKTNGLTWDEVIIRFADRSAPDMIRHPEVLESLLASSSDTYATKQTAGGAALSGVSYEDYTSLDTAAALGLFHRLLRITIELGDAFQAMKAFKALLDFVDRNKEQAIYAFAEKVNNSSGANGTMPVATSAGPTSASSSATYPSFFVSLPTTLIADLLELFSREGLFDVCNWMIHSNSVEGPLINDSMFTSPIVVPALLQFAMRSNDTFVINKIKELSPGSLTSKTIVSSCVAQLELDNLEGATRVLQFMRDKMQHRWTAEELARVLQAILPLVASRVDEAKKAKASALLVSLIRDEFGQGAGSARTDFKALASVLASVDEELANMCAPCLGGFNVLDLELNRKTFEVLLRGCVNAYGSETGKKLWETWCDGSLSREIHVEPSSKDGTERGSSPSFDSPPAAEGRPVDGSRTPGRLTVVGHVRPAISTVRIIARQAAEELKSSPTKEESRQSSRQVIAWAEEILRRRFSLRPDRVAKNLGGYSAATEAPPLSDAPYSPTTLDIWKGIMEMRKGQTLPSMETEMRAVAAGSGAKSATFEAISRIERKFVHDLALDLGLVAESFGQEPNRGVAVFREAAGSQVPARTVGDCVGASRA